MSDYLSGRQTDLKIGISSYSENKTVLEVVGKSVLGVTSVTDLSADTLKVSGNFEFANFTANGLIISGIITSGRFISTITTGAAPISVASSTLVNNLNVEYLNGHPEAYYRNASNLNTGFVPAERLYSANNFNVFGDLYVSNDLSVGGTSIVLNAQSLQIKDRDVVLGITTDAFGNDISTDLTANHGGVAIASTVGNPLFSFAVSGINSIPDTYKQIMWVKSGTFAGFNTDAFLFNYAVGVGTNQLNPGVRFRAGALEVTDYTVNGFFVGNLQGNAATATTATNLSGGIKGDVPYQDAAGITTFLSAGPANNVLLSNGPGLAPYWGPATSIDQTFTGITIKDEGATVGITSRIIVLDFVGPNVRATSNPTPTGIATITIDDYVSRAGLSTNVSGGIASVTSLSVTGPSTLGSVQISAGIVTATAFVGNVSGTATSAQNLTGGVQGSVPFQKSIGITSFLSPGFLGHVLITNGNGQDPYWGPVSAATGSFGGVTVQDEGVTQGTASSISTLNFVGPRITARATEGASGIATVTLEDYVSVAGYSTISGIATYAINAGISTNVIGGIAALTNLNVTGPSTLGTIQFSGGIVTANTFSGNHTGTANLTNLNVTGPSTFGNVQISDGIVAAKTGIITYYGDGRYLTGATGLSVVTQTLTNDPTFITFANNIGVSSIGISNSGTNSFVFIPTTGFAGLGSTTPTSKLDVVGDAKFTGVVTATRFSGDGSSLTNINATSIVGVTQFAVTAGVATNVSGGIATVTALNVTGIGTTRPVQVGSGSSIVVVDSLGEVGIGTSNPQYPLDVVGDIRVSGNVYTNNVISSDARVGEIIRTSAGLVSTNSSSPLVLDTYNTSQFRSAKYTIQVTSQGSLILGTVSISSITGGTNYFPGTYTNQNIISGGSGIGSYAKATITAVPEFSIGINSCIDGVFTSSAILPSGITTNKSVFFTQNLNLSQRQQSQISQIGLSTSGIGYTGVPTLTSTSPTIAGNTVPEVGIGSTARAQVVSMLVSNAVQTSAGFVTNVIPTITFSGPSTGVTALGLVSFGISTINVALPGSGYTTPPSITIAAPRNPVGFAATVGLGISSLNWVVTGGSGYTDGDLVAVSFNPVGGIGTGAAITGVGVGGTIQFSITNPGISYTTPPLVSVDSTGTTGTGATVSIARMIVSNVIVTNPGSGVTVGLARTNDITFSGGGGTGAGATATTLVSTGVSITNAGFGYTSTTIPTITYEPLGAAAAQVGLGISAIQLLSTGIGYTVVPTITASPGPSVGTTRNAGFTTSLGYAGFAGTTIIAGPGYSGTSVYYINVLTNRTFTISTSIGSGLTPGTGIVGYGFSVGLSTSRTGTVSIAGTTLITGITTSGITVGTLVQNNTVLSPGTTVASIGNGTIFITPAALNTGSLSTSFNFGSTLIIGGRVNAVNITEIGSGYVAFQTNTARSSNFDRESIIYDSNVGTGFTFTVANVVNNFQLSELLTLHSVGSGSTSAYIVEEAGIADVTELGEYSVSLSGAGQTVFNLNFTPVFAFNTVKFNKTLFTI